MCVEKIINDISTYIILITTKLHFFEVFGALRFFFKHKKKFQAPTPTRFIGRMHAIVSKEDKRRKSVSSVKDTIKEVFEFI